ncbi:MAG: HTTM domain-containing protein [Stagnimonas sp.]|nr:HTTM domain-containing protein [Stagnimonas sp.]
MTQDRPALIHPRLHAVFGIDLRTLALFRASLGSVLLFEVLRHFGDLSALYSDWGVMPRTWLVQADTAWHLSLFLINGTPLVTGALLAVQALAALALLLGWRTRLATVLSFFLWGWLCNRNPLVLIGGDLLMACLLFWACFLPWGARWSVDAALSPEPPPRDHRHLSWGSAGLLLQVMSVYFFSAFLKSGVEWVPDYTAVYYALSLDRYATPLGSWLLQFPELLRLLTAFVWWLELLGPPLILLAPLLGPRLGSPLRAVLMLAFMGMHVGFLLCLELGHFPFVSLSSLSVFLGAWFWDWRTRQPRVQRPVAIYYDLDCGFCLKTTRLFQTFLGLQQARISPAQQHPRAKGLLEANWSWVVIDHEDRAWLKWSAFVALLRYSPIFGWLQRPLSAPALEAPGNLVYDFVGRHRGAFAAVTAALLPERQEGFVPGPRWQGVAALFLVLVACWNLATIKLVPAGVQQQLTPLFQLLRIEQLWNMFAPFPLKDDGWMVVEGSLANGDTVNVLQPGQPLSYGKPHQLSQTHRNIRWHTYLGRLSEKEFAAHRLWFGKYLCRSRNADKLSEDREHRLMRFNINYVVETTPPPGQPTHTEQRTLWSHECFPLTADSDDEAKAP